MKKYLFGAVALVLAIGFSAFTVPAKKAFATKIFQIKSTVDLTQPGSVSLYSNWEEAPVQSFDCASAQQQACKIEVSDLHYTGSALNSNITINELQAGGTYRVDAASPGDIDAVNNTFR